jgi:MscS family membrane protein
VRVGDFCSFGDHMGTIEEIGLRSTRVRALDRTLVSIPNARFADLEIINWAKCDQMLINATIGLRFETTPDQMRYALAKIREMLHAHPKIDPATIRVRYIGPGASSRDVSVRIYALTREWNEFFAIREDVFLRIDDIVEEAGSGYAFPSQTLYMTRDEGLDRERSEAAVQEVQAWRHSGKLPFPRLAAARMAELGGTLDYPPRGSVDTSSARPTEPEPQPLSIEPLSAETPDEPPAAEAQEEGERHR